MISSTRFAAVLVLTACALGTTSPAEAQVWLQDRQYREGPGIRVGNLELHPGLGVEAGYDTNVFLEQDDPRGSFVLRTSAHFDVSTVGPQRSEGEEQDEAGQGTGRKVDFRAGVGASLYWFAESRARTDVGLNGDVSLTILPGRPFNVTLFDTYRRQVRPFTDQSAGNNFARSTNDAGILFKLATRGDVLSGRLGYTFQLNFWESDTFDYLNNFNHRVDLGLAYRFLPSTALFWESTMDYGQFRETPSVLRLSDNTRLRSRIGINGAVSRKVSVLLAAGYAAVFLKDDTLDELDTAIAQAELRLQLASNVKLSFGYERDIFSSPLGNYRTRDRGYATLQLVLGRSFLLGFNTWVGFLKFGNIVNGGGGAITTDGSIDRSDVFVSATLFGEYRFTDWLALNATVSYTGDFTDFEYQRMLPAGLTPEPAGFSKFQAWLGLRVFY